MGLEEEALLPPEPQDNYLACLYGSYGKRKTTTACSLVRDHGLLISADNSWKVLNRERHQDLLDKVTIVQYTGLSQLEYINYTDFDTVILDTFSKMVDNFLDLVLDKADWAGRYREKLKTKEESLKGIEIPAPMDYRVVRDNFRPALGKLIEAPVNKVFTFHVNDPIPGLSLDDTRKPRIPNSTWEMIAEMADVIGWLRYMGSSKGFTISVDEKSTVYVGKSRIDGIEKEMSLDDFVKVWKENTWVSSVS